MEALGLGRLCLLSRLTLALLADFRLGDDELSFFTARLDRVDRVDRGGLRG